MRRTAVVQAQCNAYQLPPSMLDEFSSVRNNTSNVNFTFVGYEDMDGMWVTFACGCCIFNEELAEPPDPCRCHA